MASQLFKPTCNMIKCLSLCYVIYEHCSNGTSVVSTSYCPVPLLSSSIPYLCLDCLLIYRNCPGLELNSNGSL
eukprot:Gb_28848 [translate_table: standard]